jgi:hypothetical protein
MTSSPSDSSLAAEVADLRARLAVLEAERAAARRRNRRLAFAAVGLAVISGTVASAANGNCPNGLPFCFTPDSPAQASQVNHNFMQLKEWIETKVGATSSSGVSASTITASGTVTANGSARVTGGGLQVHAGGAVSPPASTGRALWATGSTTAYDAPIADFRHDNLTQGIGIGWNSIVATGSAADQYIYLKPKGAGQVEIDNGLRINGTINFVNRSCRSVNTACSSQGGGEAIYLDRHDVGCNGDEVLRRFRLQTCSGGMYYQYTCCPI